MNARNLGVVFGRKLTMHLVLGMKLIYFYLSHPDEIVRSRKRVCRYGRKGVVDRVDGGERSNCISEFRQPMIYLDSCSALLKCLVASTGLP